MRKEIGSSVVNLQAWMLMPGWRGSVHLRMSLLEGECSTQRKSQCKRCKTELCLVYLGNTKEVHVAWALIVTASVVSGEVGEWTVSPLASTLSERRAIVKWNDVIYCKRLDHISVLEYTGQSQWDQFGDCCGNLEETWWWLGPWWVRVEVVREVVRFWVFLKQRQ